MLSKAQRLAKSAEDSARFRGHTLKSWQWHTRSAERTIGIAECKDCGAYVQVDTRPEANGIDVGGTAVAIGCYPQK